jgi:hypothetical protein
MGDPCLDNPPDMPIPLPEFPVVDLAKYEARFGYLSEMFLGSPGPARFSAGLSVWGEREPCGI